MSIPIDLSPGRSGFTPDLALGYDSGSGNGPFGFGWSLGLPAVTRKTDRGLPRYEDAPGSEDVFVLSGAEDLVRVLDGAAPVVVERTVHGSPQRIHHYRPRVEGAFARIERWEDLGTGISRWRTIGRDNVVTLFGWDAASRVADPDDPLRVFSWLISRTFDDRGNAAFYAYLAEDGAGVDLTAACEANRGDGQRLAQRYLKSVRYANRSPYRVDWTAAAEPAPPDAFLFEVVFDYGDHASATPAPAPDATPAVRPDPFSTHRPGFELRTYRRCRRILLFHHFPDEPGVGAGCLVRATRLRYADETAAGAPDAGYSLLVSATRSGYRRQGDGYVERSLPPLELEYSGGALSSTVRTLDPETAENLPEGLSGRYRLVDLDGDGLPGILSDDGTWRFKRNVSPVTAADGELRARFQAAEMLRTLPSDVSLQDPQILDVDGTGRVAVVRLSAPHAGFTRRAPDGEWEPFEPFARLPNIDFGDPDVRLVDLTGDGLADVLVTHGDSLRVHPSLGAEGFGEGRRAPIGWDEARAPSVVFSDGTQTLFLADMSGDGLSDLVRVRNGDIAYWPSLGHGRFGPRIAMDGAPRFAEQSAFDPGRIRLADVDGSGTADVVYAGPDGVHVSFNRCGNGWSPPRVLAAFPSAASTDDVQVADLLGTGTACLVWSSPLPANGGRTLRYVDLMGGRKPHLLTRIRNNLGVETRLTYAPSTRFAVADRLAGREWVTRLPFPVHVVERVEAHDAIARSRFVTRYAYHHGYFDPHEREFRGFGLVEQWDTEERREDGTLPEGDNWDEASAIPPVLTRTWFHTGAPPDAAGAISAHYEREYWVEPALRAPEHAAGRRGMLLEDTAVPPGLDAGELREACRALRGTVLRTEVFAHDGSARAEHPFTVSEQSFSVRLLQARGPNPHAVVLRHAREMVALHYERDPSDPRVTHDLTLEVDDFGNVRRSVSVAYPRRAGAAAPAPALSPAYQAMLAHDQGRMHVAATAWTYTNAFADPAATPDVHRTPLPCEKVVAELTGLVPEAAVPGIASRFGFDELLRVSAPLWRGEADVPFEEVAPGDLDGRPGPAGPPARRVVERRRILYRRDDLTGLLELGRISARALPGEDHQLALTPAHLSRVFGTRLPDAVLSEGGYVRDDAGVGWWVPSGRVFYSADGGATPAQERAEAEAHFHLPRRAVDALGGTRSVTYDRYDLLTTVTTDPVGNAVAAASDYRVLQPRRVTDPNGNRVDAVYDALGFVAATAVMGKAGESVGDSLAGVDPDPPEPDVLAHLADPLADPRAMLGSATARTLYDVGAYHRTRDLPDPSPPAVCSLSRETHVSDLEAGARTRYVHAFAYADGFGREIQRKAQAEPDPGAGPGPRWIGSGWTVHDNKGRPVRTHEPFFSDTHRFEPARLEGVATTLFYDPLERVVGTLRPDGAFEKTRFGAWRQESWDANDTVLIADPREDPDLGGHLRRLLRDAPFVSWHDRRATGQHGADPAERAAQQDAAQKAAAHAGTTTVLHFDSRGRTCVRIAGDGSPAGIPTRIALDPESRPLATFDARGRRVREHCLRERDASDRLTYVLGYDMLGQTLCRTGMDEGRRLSVGDALGRPLRAWDARGHAIRWRHDAAGRLTHRYVAAPDRDEILVDRVYYGEGLADRNLCGRAFRHFDTAGVLGHERYDFAGRLLETTRRLASDHRSTPDWSPIAEVGGADAAESVVAGRLSSERFAAATLYDALGRPVQVVTPHGAGVRPNVIGTTYNEAGLLESIGVWLRPAAAPTRRLDPAAADMRPVTAVAYDARSEVVEATLGNGAVTTREHDPQTHRLVRLSTQRPAAAGERLVQDLRYAYDPAGNVTRIRDLADTQNTVFFRNRRVDPTADYTYDPLYRLVRASGREHLGQTGDALAAPVPTGHGDGPRGPLAHPADGNAMDTYVERYAYDPAGNLTSLVHQVSSGSWTRRFAYDETSAIDAAETGNRLSSTSVPGDPDAGPFSQRYEHDAAGNTTRMPHLPSMVWDEHDRLRSVAQQRVNAGSPETTFYAYDAAGERVRKVVDRQSATAEPGAPLAERIYLGPIEVQRRFGPDGRTVTMQREILYVTAGSGPVARVETQTAGHDEGPARIVRYRFTNHLDSATLELDETAAVASYEEYFPYGSTAYRATRGSTETGSRRRFSGKERDEESGLYYFGARYYAPWLGRWTAADPKPSGDGGPNAYAYARDNPVKFVDPDGRDVRISVDQQTHTITYATTVHFFGTAAEIAQVRPVVRQAQAFYANPTIETSDQTRARWRSNGQAPTGGNVFTDASGTRWTVRFDVRYQLHDISRMPSSVSPSTVTSQAGAQNLVTNLAGVDQDLRTAVGFVPGDNVMSMQAQGAGVGGVTQLISTQNAAFPTFGRPENRMTSTVTGVRAHRFESITHETGHHLGFDERYTGGPFPSDHPEFEFDFMSASSGISSPGSMTMHPEHIRQAAEFALGVANGRTLVGQALRGARIDDTDGGTLATTVASGATPAYAARQALVASELVPHFRAAVTGTTPPPPPAPTLPPAPQRPPPPMP